MSISIHTYLLRDIGMGEPIHTKAHGWTIQVWYSSTYILFIGKKWKKMLSIQRLCVFYVFLIVWVCQIKIYSCMPELINISDLTHRIWNPTIVSPVKMEYGWNFSISGLKKMVKSGLKKYFWNSSMRSPCHFYYWICTFDQNSSILWG